MSSRELLALIVGGVDYGDADRVVHLLTAHGRLSAFAHGAKKSRRRFAGALEPFSSVRLSVSERSGASGMPTLSASVVLAPRLAIRSELARIALASHVVELAARVSPEAGASEQVLSLAERTLDRLVEGPASTGVRRAFELLLVATIGYAPELEGCVECGLVGGRVFIDLSRGGLCCQAHRGAAPELGPKTLEWARRVLAEERGGAALDERAGLDEEWVERAAAKLGVALDAFYSGLLARPLASAALLRDVGL